MMSEWKLVPVEPTSEMTAAACHVVVEQDRGGVQCLWPTEAQAIYAAMLSAAPEPSDAALDAMTDAAMALVEQRFRARAYMSRDDLRAALRAAAAARGRA